MLLAIGDPHIKAKLLPDFYAVFDEILELIVKKHITEVVILGDVLHNNTRLDLQCLYDATNFIMDIAMICPVVVIMGNHDMINNSQICNPVSAFHALSKVHNVTVVTKPVMWHDYLCIPYLPKGMFKEHVEPLLQYKPKIIFAHQEFKDSKDGKFVSLDGDSWTKQDGPLVISGHIHEEQRLNNVYYTGSLDKGILCKVDFVPIDDNVKSSDGTNDGNINDDINNGVGDGSAMKVKLTKIKLKTVIHKKVRYVTVEQLATIETVAKNERIVVNCHDCHAVENSYDYLRLVDLGIEIKTRKLPSVINIVATSNNIDGTKTTLNYDFDELVISQLTTSQHNKYLTIMSQ